ncbi:MAG: MltA domain-containing protein [Abitibacteriaceae bacterium]|nr:MltA domain-containing protein [Abditibacteriaceae bacterium]MBV9868604.1 MltA domain-containing protein [Abditibacteriaceae bacterium]
MKQRTLIIALLTIPLSSLNQIKFGITSSASSSQLPHSLVLTSNVPWQAISRVDNRQAVLRTIDLSLRYLATSRAGAAYARQYQVTGLTRQRVYRSLRRFRTLLSTARSSATLEAALRREFVCYQAAGSDNMGTVHFTGYYEPLYEASRMPNAVYRYPLYRMSHGTALPRLALEGADGLHPASFLRGAEVVWLRDRLEAYLVQVEGSARLRLRDGKIITVASAGTNGYPYQSIAMALVNDGKIRFEELTQQALIQYFRDNPQDLSRYMPRNPRFVFFRETHGAPPVGSLGLPLIGEHSIATDNSLMPPGALAFAQMRITNPYAQRVLETTLLNRYVLDQDAGSAIKGAGRVDVFMGTGTQAGERAGVINSMGSLYYLVLKQ